MARLFKFVRRVVRRKARALFMAPHHGEGFTFYWEHHEKIPSQVYA